MPDSASGFDRPTLVGDDVLVWVPRAFGGHLRRVADRGDAIALPGADNVFVERLWRTVKDEETYRRDYANPREARRDLRAYFLFYNEEQPHQALR